MSNESAPGNRLIDRIPHLSGVHQLLENVPLNLHDCIYEAQSEIDYVYFPTTAVTSALAVMQEGGAIEVATVGNEGAVGISAFFGGIISPLKVIVQIGGEGLRVKTEALQQVVNAEPGLARLLQLYYTAFFSQVSQSVACNGLHPIEKRCSRWLLMTRDRLPTDDVPLTHEYLAIMLGVRRAGVTEVLQSLKERGLLTYGRGNIRIMDRAGLEAASCECYRAVNAAYGRLLGANA